jgi:hypothetical protein
MKKKVLGTCKNGLRIYKNGLGTNKNPLGIGIATFLRTNN